MQSPLRRLSLALALLAVSGLSTAAPPALVMPRPGTVSEAVEPVAASDATVAARLDAQGVGYERDEDGDFRVVFAWQEEQRSQIAFVAGRAHVFGDSAVREVFSPAARVPEGGFDAERSDMILRDSQSNILGAWEIAGDVLFYVIKLHDDADGARLEQALEAAAQLADDMEQRLTGEDAL